MFVLKMLHGFSPRFDIEKPLVLKFLERHWRTKVEVKIVFLAQSGPIMESYGFTVMVPLWGFTICSHEVHETEIEKHNCAKHESRIKAILKKKKNTLKI